jgi:hypothetical protein
MVKKLLAVPRTAGGFLERGPSLARALQAASGCSNAEGDSTLNTAIILDFSRHSGIMTTHDH